jgi:phosphatidylglycerophosphatase A
LLPYLLFVICFIVFSSWICGRVSHDIGIHDHPGITIDEFVGFFVTMIHAPKGVSWIILGFILFRVFDILKPWPIHTLDEKIQGGFGIVLDDIVAGIYACLIIQLLSLIFA